MTEKEIGQFGEEFEERLRKYCPNFLDTTEIANLACELLPLKEEEKEEEQLAEEDIPL